MKRYIIGMAMAMLSAASASAEVWSLDSCLCYAAEHNLQIKLSDISTIQGKQAVDEAKSGYLPTVNANASQSWNLGRGLTAQNTYADRNTTSFSWSASASVPVFDGLRTPRQLDYARASLTRIIESYEAAKEDVSINVIAAYLQVLYTRELWEVAQQQVQLSTYELTRRTDMVEAGKLPEIDILEAKSLLANDELSEVQAHNNYMLAKIDLARLLNLDTDIEAFEVAPLTDEAACLPSPEETLTEARRYSHNVQAAQKGIVASEANIRLSQTGYIPTLSLGAGVGSSYYNVSGMENEKFSDQMRHNYSTYFGLTLNIPIFDAFGTRNSVRRAKVEKLNAELQLEQAEDELQRTIHEVYFQAVGAQKKYETGIVANDYASKAFEATREKYNLGKATSADYEQSKTKAMQAQSELIQAGYELRLRLRLLRFYSTPH